MRNTTLPAVTFYTWRGDEILANADAVQESTLISISTQKNLGPPCGSWTVEVTGTHSRFGPWTDLLDEGDWVTIDVTKNGRASNLMTGRVDAVDLAIEEDSGGGGRTGVTITGRDVGQPLQDTPVYFNVFDPLHNNVAGKDMAAILDRVSGSPDQVVHALIEGFFGDQTKGLYGAHVKIPPGLVARQQVSWLSALDTTSLVQRNLKGTGFFPALLATDQNSSVWSMIDAHRNRALNEVFVDTLGPVAERRWYLTVRERPFANPVDGPDSPWFRLPTRRVHTNTVQAVRTSRGHDRKNHVMLYVAENALLGNDPFATFVPKVNQASVDRYGLRQFMEQTDFFNDQAELATGWKAWLDLIVAWNCLNHRHWEGSLVLGELRPDIRIGHRVVLDGPSPRGYRGWAHGDMGFYVEGVSHQLTTGARPTARTVLRVSRGYAEADRLADIAAEMQNWTDLSSIPEGSATTGPLEPVELRAEIDALVEG